MKKSRTLGQRIRWNDRPVVAVGVEHDDVDVGIVDDVCDDVERCGQWNRRRAVEVDRKYRSFVPGFVLEFKNSGPSQFPGHDDERQGSVLMLN